MARTLDRRMEHTVGATKEDWKPWGTRTVAHTESTGELDTGKLQNKGIEIRSRGSGKNVIFHVFKREKDLQVTDGDVVTSNEGLVLVDDFVDTGVGVVLGFDVVEDDNRTIGTSATADASATCVVKQDAVM